MPARDELPGAFVECLREVSSLLGNAHATALRQRDALTESDAEAIAVECISLDEILRRIGQSDERAAAVAARITEQTGVDIGSADENAVAEAVGSTYAALITSELGHIRELAQRLRDVNEVNSALIAGGLDVITSCLRIVAREPEPTVYSRSASLSGAGDAVLSLDSRV